MNRYFKPLSAHIIFSSLFLVFLLTACGGAGYKINGRIEGADKDLLTLEKADFNGRWIILDSIRTGSDGSFEFTGEPFGNPEILRISLNGSYIYLPLDSIETITVKANKAGFGKNHSLEGSDQARAMAEFDNELASISSEISPDSLNKKKKDFFSKYMQPYPGSLLSYYILTKDLNGKPLFNPFEGDDYKFFAAVATAFKQSRPNDPRTPMLEQTGIEALKQKNSRKGLVKEIPAQEISLIEISLPDEKGMNKTLSSSTSNGKTTLLLFSFMTAPESPALHQELNNLLQSRGGNFEIYEVSLDPDRYEWRDAASNLPWTTVFDSDGVYSPNAAAYNVTELPAFFIFDSSGALTDRVFSVDELKKKI